MAIDTRLISKEYNRKDAFTGLKNFGKDIATALATSEQRRKERAEQQLRDKVQGFTEQKKQAVGKKLEDLSNLNFRAGETVTALEQRLIKLEARRDGIIGRMQRVSEKIPDSPMGVNTPLDQQQIDGNSGMPLSALNSAQQFGRM